MAVHCWSRGQVNGSLCHDVGCKRSIAREISFVISPQKRLHQRLSLQGAKRGWSHRLEEAGYFPGKGTIGKMALSYAADRVMPVVTSTMLINKEDRLLKTLLAWPEMMEAWMDAKTMEIQERGQVQETLKHVRMENGESRCEKSYVAQVSNTTD